MKRFLKTTAVSFLLLGERSSSSRGPLNIPFSRLLRANSNLRSRLPFWISAPPGPVLFFPSGEPPSERSWLSDFSFPNKGLTPPRLFHSDFFSSSFDSKQRYCFERISAFTYFCPLLFSLTYSSPQRGRRLSKQIVSLTGRKVSFYIRIKADLTRSTQRLKSILNEWNNLDRRPISLGRCTVTTSISFSPLLLRSQSPP